MESVEYACLYLFFLLTWRINCISKILDICYFMKIHNIIDRTFKSISIFEDTRDVWNWLSSCQYSAVVDENLTTVGIITAQDIIASPEARNISDCNFIKPSISHDQNIQEAFEKMKAHLTFFLPVYNAHEFVGVISLLGLTVLLFKTYCSLGM